MLAPTTANSSLLERNPEKASQELSQAFYALGTANQAFKLPPLVFTGSFFVDTRMKESAIADGS